MDLNKLPEGGAEPIASAARIETWNQIENGVEFELTAPKDVTIVSRIHLPKEPRKMTIDDRECTDFNWDQKGKTVFFKSPPIEQKQTVRILW